MASPLSLFIGGRFTRAKKRNRMVSFISVSSMIGIAVGVAVIILGLSTMNGFERELENRILGVIPHGELEGVNEPFMQWPQLAQKIEEHPKVVSTAPYVTMTGLLEKGAALKAVQVRGIDKEREQTISNIAQYIDDEAWAAFEPGKQQVILGQGIAAHLNVEVGEWLTVMLPDPAPSRQLKSPQRLRMQVIGLLSLGGQIDHSLAIVPLEDAQEYANMISGVTGISIKVDDVFNAPHIVREAGFTLPVRAYIKHWKHEFGYLYRDIQLVRLIMYIVMVLVIGVACFNIVSTLMMAVKDRAGDIAILRTMGAGDRLISGIFVWQGLLSGLIGCGIGAVVGVVASLNLPRLMLWLESLSGSAFLSGDIYFVDFLPTQLLWSDVATVTLTALGLSLIATWYPARRAAALDPALVLSSK
ncbi:lipoprotein-releasing ABC transporter permease subunit LolE [Thaumasiovibrio subtropicus]|uniref:lipoprotein-releasing ABC transporter permease subunit LolE n=1 Tax=Thaumasiovibrio subtropicus TaxID=1891207 RepID=UPI000B357E47|nr:lipoprotein-releasing ABC transporter permease subunit LolE [Thaumasiovibrio subtropicus]